jgi:hypothetical protein
MVVGEDWDASGRVSLDERRTLKSRNEEKVVGKEMCGNWVVQRE